MVALQSPRGERKIDGRKRKLGIEGGGGSAIPCPPGFWVSSGEKGTYSRTGWRCASLHSLSNTLWEVAMQRLTQWHGQAQ